jgi:hypothetical protein
MAGKLPQFTPTPLMDHSNRIVEGFLHIVTPFSALGFDLLAKEVSFDDKCVLSDVASLEHRLSYVCPL